MYCIAYGSPIIISAQNIGPTGEKILVHVHCQILMNNPHRWMVKNC